MVYFLAGCLVLLVLLLLSRQILRANPRKLADAIRKFGALALFGVAGLLALRGAVALAVPLAAFALSLLVRGSGFGGLGGGNAKSDGQASHVKTERLEMALDHDTGAMDGRCLEGRFAGRTLSSLSDDEVIELYRNFEADGVKEAALMEAYLNWRLPGWQEKADANDDQPGTGGFSKDRMSVEEAQAVLEVGPQASEDEIRQAHRRLMMKLHPDHGGSNYLAARINEAKDVLLSR